MSIRFLDQMDIEGKRLLIRVDYNVPIKEGVIQDDLRIRESLPTLRYALERKAALVLCAHAGRPKGERKPEYTLAPIAEHLSRLLDREVKMAPDCVGEETERMARNVGSGEVLLLENLRFHKGETENDPEFSAQLARMGEIYVDDAFGVSHRAHASVVGVVKHFDQCCGGLLLKKENEFLSKAIGDPERPYLAVSGGAKVSSKLGVLSNLLDTVDSLVIGGAMANTFLLAQGMEVGNSLVEADLAESAKRLMQTASDKGVDLHLPVDFVVADDANDETARGTFAADSIPADAVILDIGPQSVETFARAISGAKTIMWNGPMGLFETPAFAEGSLGVARAMADVQGATTIIGGGDTDAVIHRAGLADRFTFVSTGGGSFLEFLEGKELPAFKALKECGE